MPKLAIRLFCRSGRGCGWRRRRRGGRRRGRTAGGRRGSRGCSRGSLRLGVRIDPAGVDPIIQALLHLVIDLRTKPRQAAEGGLDMPARATEPVVKVEVTKGGIEVVAPHQANDTAAEPDTFRVTGGAVDRLRGFRKFIRPALVILGGIGAAGGRFTGLILIGRGTALGKCGAGADQKCQPGDGEATQNRNLELKHPLTHEFPDLVLARPAATQCRPNGSPMRRSGSWNPMTDILDFVQQTHNFIGLW